MLIERASNIDYTTEYSPPLLESIMKDVESARTHLNNHVTMEAEILNLDKDCEYCQIYFKE